MSTIPANDALSANYEKEGTVLVRNVARNCKPRALPLLDPGSLTVDVNGEPPALTAQQEFLTARSPACHSAGAASGLLARQNLLDGGLASFCEKQSRI